VYVAVYTASISILEAKWVRYLLPLVPPLCLFAAMVVYRFVAWLTGALPGADHTAHNEPRARGLLAPALIVVFMVGSAVISALAFNAIYGSEHTRVRASQWIYNNVPYGESVASEGADAYMPLALGAHARPEDEYHQVRVLLLADDPSEKGSARLYAALSQTNYLVVARAAVYRTVRSMPWRYPVQNRYYDLLYSGQLGFTPVYSAFAYPSIFGVQFPDDDIPVDSSFIEYDHPPVTIFKKEKTLSEAEWSTLFADAVRTPSRIVRRP
jgi:hypothetical protein